MQKPKGWAAAWMRGRGELLQRWRYWLVVALLVGVTSGLLVGAAAGARRTSTVYDRLLEGSNAFDLLVAACPAELDPENCGDDANRAFGKLLASPLVADGTLVTDLLLPVFTEDGRLLQPPEAEAGDPCFTGAGEIGVVGSENGRYGTEINRYHFTAGRPADPTSANEVVVSDATARRLGIDIGEGLRIVPVDACDGPPEDEWPAPIDVTVVGTELSALEIEPESGFFLQSVTVTPPLLRELTSHGLGGESDAGVVRLRPGVTPSQLVEAAAREGVSVQVALDRREFEAGVERGLRPDAATLWLLTAIGTAAALIVLSQTLTRQVRVESSDVEALRAIGFASRELAMIGAIKGAAVGIVGGVVATATAVAVSPLAPIGRARHIEPDPGVQFDALVVGAGAAVVAVVWLVVVTVASWWVSRTAGRRRSLPAKPSLAGTLAGRLRLPSTMVCGTRMALEPGRGANTVPVRSGLAGMVVALAALVGALTFVAGLDHLVSTPRLVGLNWDSTYFGGYENAADSVPELDAAVDRAVSIDGVARVGYATFFQDVEAILDDRPEPVWLMSFSTGAHAIAPTVTSGRAPSGPSEIMLTGTLLDDLGLEIGDPLVVHGSTQPLDGAQPEPTSSEVEVVGTGVLPVGDGRFDTAAALTFDGLRRIAPHAQPHLVIADYEPGADRARVDRELAQLGFRGRMSSEELDALKLVNIDVRQAEAVPRLLAALMAILATGIVVHLIATAGRMRRREFAVLRALGFTPRQVRASTAWQATTLGSVSMVGGGVIGIIAGRALWRLYANRLAVVPEPAQPWLATGLLLIAVLLLANLVAWIAGRPAARFRPAEPLRTE